jgi:DNA-binding transcriptional MerR regulator
LSLKPLNLEKPLRVGELAKRTKKTVRALHLYEELGLLKPVHRSKGGFRLYSSSSVERVAWIGLLQEAGFSLHQLQEFLTGFGEGEVGNSAMQRVRDIFEEKLRATREQKVKLEQLEKELEASLAYLDGCKSCAPVHLTNECGTCDHNGHHQGEQPLLVAGIHRG